jgi:transcription initiation factor TFIIIB Brf1 subunit/transcription initiation factor TFIIB
MLSEIVTYTGTSAKKLKKIKDNFQNISLAVVTPTTAATTTTTTTSSTIMTTKKTMLTPMNRHCNNPTAMVNKYCHKLGLDFTATKAIEHFVTYWHDKCASHSLCLVASAIYIYCRRNEIDLTLREIAKTCWISPPSIYRFIKKNLTDQHERSGDYGKTKEKEE